MHLNVHPRAVMRRLRFFRCKHGSNFEIFEYDSPDQNQAQPKNSDVGGHHLAFYVDDLDAAVAYLAEKECAALRQTNGQNDGAECRTNVDLLSFTRGECNSNWSSFPHGKRL